jgi:dihydroorotase
MLVDNYITLNRIFKETELLIATHCEEEKIIKENLEKYQKEFGVLLPKHHPLIRDVNACFESSYKAVLLAKQNNTRLHILHITTAKELQLFSNMMPLKDKQITCEVCVHHLHFTADDYETKGHLIKCNPAIKDSENKVALWNALNNDTIDVIATDHAPHLLTEKGYNEQGELLPITENSYASSHAGLPLIQHGLQLLLHYYKLGLISLEHIAKKMSHDVAICYQIKNRGFIKEGFAADAVIVDLNKPQTVEKNNLLYKCAWSPFEGFTLPATITHTFVNGNLVYGNGVFNESTKGERLLFDRN